MDCGKKVILFGAGEIGRKALAYFGAEQVYCFVDNSEQKIGTAIEKIPIIAFSALKKIHREYQIVITVETKKALIIAAQLEDSGITDYQIFLQLLSGGQGLPEYGKDWNRGSEAVQKADSGESRRVLMIAYLFPPLSGSGVFRTIKFAKYLPEFGWHPAILSTDLPLPDQSYVDGSLVEEIPRGMEVIRIPDLIGTLREAPAPAREAEALAFLWDAVQDDETAAKIFSALNGSRVGRAELFTTPCASLSWACDAARYIEQNMDLRQFRVIYTTSSPYSTHLIGAYLQKRYGIPWVADYRDPWTGDIGAQLDYSQPCSQLFARLEHILLRQADCNITVEKSLVDSYADRFQLPRNKIMSITNGYDEQDFAQLKPSAEQEGCFVINYSGLLYTKPAINGLSAVLNALTQLKTEGAIEPERVRFRMIGDAKADCPEILKQYNLGSMLEQIGYCSHRDALQSNLDADLLLLLIGDDARLKPVHAGKLFDYLRSGQTILALAPEGGAIEQILRETGQGMTFRTAQVPELKAAILREYRRWEREGRRVPRHSPLIEQYERKCLTGNLADIFNRVGRQEAAGS